MSTFGTPPTGPNQPQVVYVAAAPPQRSLISRLFGIVQTLFFVFIALSVLVAIYAPDSIQVDDPESKVEERYQSGSHDGPYKVAIIEIDGQILDAESVRRQCEKAAKDEHVKALVLRVDSPGGTVTASDQMYHYLRNLVTLRKLPLVVSMGGMAASGGYYVSMAAGDAENVIFAEPTTWTGSIGVIIPYYDLSGLAARFDVVEDSIASGPLKGMGNPARKMKPEERAVLEELVADSFRRFKDIVTAARPKLRNDPATLAKATTGQVFTVKQAIELGLVDKEGFLEDAVKRAMELANIQADVTKVVKYRKPKSLVDTLVGAKAQPTVDPLRALGDLTTPRAYFLYAWPWINRGE